MLEDPELALETRGLADTVSLTIVLLSPIYKESMC